MYYVRNIRALSDVCRCHCSGENTTSNHWLHESKSRMRWLYYKFASDAAVQSSGRDNKRCVGGGMLDNAVEFLQRTARKKEEEFLTIQRTMDYTKTPSSRGGSGTLNQQSAIVGVLSRRGLKW